MSKDGRLGNSHNDEFSHFDLMAWLIWVSLKPKLNFYPTLMFFDWYHQIVGKTENHLKKEGCPMFFIQASWTLAYFPSTRQLFLALQCPCWMHQSWLFSKKAQKNFSNQSKLFKDLNGMGCSWSLVVDWILRPKGFLLFFPINFNSRWFGVSFKPKCRSIL